jgi:hypothetical protein
MNRGEIERIYRSLTMTQTTRGLAGLDLKTQTLQCAASPRLVDPPAHEHPSFEEIGISQERIWRAADALLGIASMMRVEVSQGHQMNMATIDQAGAVFLFFGEYLKIEAEEIIHHRDKIVEELSS